MNEIDLTKVINHFKSLKPKSRVELPHLVVTSLLIF
jgi:hypothetical protein